MHAVKQKRAIGKPSHGKAGGDGRIHSLGTERTYQDSLKTLLNLFSNIG